MPYYQNLPPERMSGAEARAEVTRMRREIKEARAHQYAYRLLVTSWPTPDRQPFAEQPYKFWEEIVDAYLNPSDSKPYPEWLPDIGPWLATEFDGPRDGHPIGEHGDLAAGDRGNHLMNVPRAPGRRYFTRKTLMDLRDELIAWGCTAHIERGEIKNWVTIR